MIPLDKFMRGVDEIIDSKPVYKLGGDGRAGLCDCIGLIIGAIRRAGGTWSGTHGSNYAARNEMQSLESPPRLEVGAAVYKYHEQGQAGWNLPAAYKNHPDQNDYYHVGVVLSVSPLRIAHCTSWSGGSGIKIDTTLGKWKHGGRIKGVAYHDNYSPPKEVTRSMTGRIDLPPERNVFLRIKPDKSSGWFARVDGGEVVEIVSTTDNWVRVRYGGYDGYIDSRYVLAGEAPIQPPQDIDINAMLIELQNSNQRDAVLIKALLERM